MLPPRAFKLATALVVGGILFFAALAVLAFTYLRAGWSTREALVLRILLPLAILLHALLELLATRTPSLARRLPLLRLAVPPLLLGTLLLTWWALPQ
jgi:hypothetical protein